MNASSNKGDGDKVRLLVTGGAGFIGSNFIHYWLTTYPTDEVINLDALTYAGNLANLKDIDTNQHYHFAHGDINNRDLVAYLLKKYQVDSIINFAAESHVDRSITEPDVFVKTNVLGTQTLLDSARRYQIKKFVQVSTDEVYGSLGPRGYFKETSSIMPNSPYSASKAAADLLVHSYYQTYGLNVNITRCSNNYGPYQFPEKLIPLMVTNGLMGKKLPLYGDGQNIRDWLYVEDHCRALDLVLHHGKAGEVYNIGGHNERRNNEIVGMIVEELGLDRSLIEYVHDRPGHDRRYAIDPTKLEQELGWHPLMSFAGGLSMTVRWYCEHPAWWQPLKQRTQVKR